MNRDEIMDILPHRASMLLIEEAHIEDGAAHGKYSVRGDEWFLDGHFPGNPVVPGVILCEILAQSACVLLADKAGKNITPYFTGLNNVKFKKPVKPGDTVETVCEIVRVHEPFYFAKGTGYVDGKPAVCAEFSFAVMEKQE